MTSNTRKEKNPKLANVELIGFENIFSRGWILILNHILNNLKSHIHKYIWTIMGGYNKAYFKAPLELKVQICGPTRIRWRLSGYLWETQLTSGHVLWQVTSALDGNSCACFNEHGFGLMLPKFRSMLCLFCWHLVM